MTSFSCFFVRPDFPLESGNWQERMPLFPASHAENYARRVEFSENPEFAPESE